MFQCYPDETAGACRTFTVWAVEADPDTGTEEAFDILSREDLTSAICAARDEIEENPAASLAFVTLGAERGSEITYAIARGFGPNNPEACGFVGHADGSPVVSFRDAERLVRA